jgi:hypothetical protein
MLARAIRWISVAICLLLATSFALFALDQMRSASQSSQAGIAGKTTSGSSTSAHHAAVRTAIDDAALAVETPFTSLGVHASNTWGEHGALFALSLLLYGGLLGFFARWVESGVSVRRRRGRGDPGPPSRAFAG